MKHFPILFVLLVCSGLAQSTGSISGVVSIPAGLKLSNIIVWVCKGSDSMCLEGPVKAIKLSGNGRTARYEAKDLPLGEYVVWAFNDKGNDGLYDHSGDEEVAPYMRGMAGMTNMAGHSMMTPSVIKLESAALRGINIQIKMGGM